MKGGHEEVKKTFLQRNHVAKEIKKKTKTKKTTWFKKEGSKTSKNNLFCKFFFFEKSKNKKEKPQRNITLFRGPTNKKHFFHQEKGQHKRKQLKKLCFFVKGENVKGENKKVEKNDDQTKQSFQKKRYTEKGTNREQHSRTRTN